MGVGEPIGSGIKLCMEGIRYVLALVLNCDLSADLVICVRNGKAQVDNDI
jgi:hypothetical protein